MHVSSRARRNRSPNLEKFQVTKITDSGKVELAAISGDGRYVCYARRDHGLSGLWLHQVATHSEVQILPTDAIGFEGLTFSPDGNHIYYVRADKSDPGFKYLYVMPVLGGSNRLLIRDIDSPVGFSPDGPSGSFTHAAFHLAIRPMCGSPTQMGAAIVCLPGLRRHFPDSSLGRPGLRTAEPSRFPYFSMEADTPTSLTPSRSRTVAPVNCTPVPAPSDDRSGSRKETPSFWS